MMIPISVEMEERLAENADESGRKNLRKIQRDLREVLMSD